MSKTNITKELQLIEESISNLKKLKYVLQSKLPLIDNVRPDGWVIQGNTYYQFRGFFGFSVTLLRNGKGTEMSLDDFNKNFRLATDEEVKQHLEYLKSKEVVKTNTPLTERVKIGSILISDNKHIYKVTDISQEAKQLLIANQNGFISRMTFKEIDDRFRQLSYDDAQRFKHIVDILTKKSNPDLPEFYMITVKGDKGSTVRHETFDKALTEATRLAKLTNHRTHIMGVTAIVEPTVVQQPVTEYKVIKNE